MMAETKPPLSQQAAPTAPVLRSLDQVLALPGNGDFAAEALVRMTALIAEMQRHVDDGSRKAKGRMTLAFDLELDRAGALEISATYDFKPPKAPAMGGIAWTTSDGGLTPHNPHQLRMDLRDASAPRDIRDT